jgi:hypothetical protein
MIIPTVGRIVWYYPSAEHKFDGKQPWAAIVTHVQNERKVALVVFEPTLLPEKVHTGVFATSNVPLLQDTDAPPADTGFCEWMPYQIGQAKRHQAEQSVPAFGCTDAECAPYEEPTR